MFDIRDAFATGWSILRENLVFLAACHVIALGVQTVPQLFIEDSPGIHALVTILSLLASFVIALGLVRVGLDLVDGRASTYDTLISYAHLVFRYLIASILHAILIFSGLIALALLLLVYTKLTGAPTPEGLSLAVGLLFATVIGVPAAILYAQFSQWPFLIVEEDLGPVQALAESSRITAGNRGRLILFYLVCAAIVLLGVLAMVVGVVFAYAVITVSTAYVYRQLTANQPESD